jgi:regulator of sirC expression with transglutaminase-like and TPR domain
MTKPPAACRLPAYQLFAEQLPIIETTAGLLNAAIAISMHALDDVEPAAIDEQLQDLAHRVSSRVRSGSSEAMLAHLHDVLFDEEGFQGNSEDYYNPLNSYLSAVLELKRGIPISLSLIYKVVGERIGLDIEGVNAPGHFVCRVMTDDGWMIVDPYVGGGVLTAEEAFERMEHVTGRPVPRTPEYLAPATHSQWLSRMLVNLQHIFATNERRSDLAAMSELQSLLDYSVY